MYMWTSLFAVDTFQQMSANTETANTGSNNDKKSEDRFLKNEKISHTVELPNPHPY